MIDRVPAAEPVFARAVSSASLAASAACVGVMIVIAALSVVFRTGEWSQVALVALGWFLALGVAVALVAFRPGVAHRIVLLVVGTTVVFAATQAVMTLDDRMADTNTLRTALPAAAMFLALGATRRAVTSIVWTTIGYVAAGAAVNAAALVGGHVFAPNSGTIAVFAMLLALRVLQLVVALRRPATPASRSTRGEQAVTRLFERCRDQLSAVADTEPGRLSRRTRARIAGAGVGPLGPRSAPSAAAADPAGGRLACAVLCAGGVLALAFAALVTVGHRDEIRNPAAAGLAFVLLAAAWAVAIRAAADRRRSPIPGDRYGLAVALAIAAALAENVSTVGANTLLYDDFGTALAGLLIVLLAPFASWRTAVSVGAAATAAAAAIAAGSAAFVSIVAPVPTFSVVAAAPVMVATAAAVAFSASFARHVMHRDREILASEFGRRRRRRGKVVSDAPEGAPAGSACADRIDVLEAEAMPLLARVAASDELTAEQVGQARRLAARLRVASACRSDATWLDDLARLASRDSARIVVDDDCGLADRLGETQRDSLASLIESLARLSRRGTVRVHVVAPEPGEWTLTVQAPPPADPVASSRIVDPMVQALRGAFDRAALISDPEAVRVVLRHREDGPRIEPITQPLAALTPALARVAPELR
ncbi:hypothetical protein ARHIZOSPH14_04410 [Agromyces rhizosphaerae]|uniref:Uncharacterized protein n=1 Tax=Agromyces rhizosphaerae TaxID=88374 RepID=A0A9W6CVQ0_9MICO|nr:hypothetical protein [Agromyces rhizosphaerae]GLI26199.1 hypothetical protein ARHIZOSPH14_04410 [Agromyces rhizosphaerae]